MNAIILAGGKGERMLPFTDKKNKCTFKVDCIPLVKWHIQHLKKAGFETIIVRTCYKPEEIFDIIYDEDVKRFHSRKLEESGTAIKKIFLQFKLDRAAVINGDTFFLESFYQNIATTYKNQQNYILIEKPTLHKTGLVLFNKKTNKIQDIFEKGAKLKTSILSGFEFGKNMGTIIIDKNTLGEGDLMTDVLPKHIDNLKVYYHQINKWTWCDIGNIDKYIELLLRRYNNSHVEWLILNKKEKAISFIKKLLYTERIIICGNGGSMSTAEHIALDFSKCGNKQAIALDSPPFITAYGNDNCFGDIFVSQLEKMRIKEDDVILVISGSGNSQNIINIAKEYPKQTIGMTGNSGWLLENIEFVLPVNSDYIRVIEDAHLAYGHAITEIMEGLI